MNFIFITFISCLLLGYSINSAAGELDFKPTITTSLIHSQNKSETSEESNTNILSVKPSVTTSYQSKRFIGAFSLDHNEIQADTSDVSQSSSFTNYQYSGDISLIEELLSVRLNGGQTYRSILSSQYFVNDFFLGADDLSKTQNNSASVFLTFPNRKYFGFELNGGISKVKSDSSSENNIEFSNNNQFVETRFYQGREFTRLSWDVTANYQNTDRSANDNLTSRVVDGNIGLGLFSNLRVVLTGRTEENELANTTNLSIGDLNYESYGLGFSWFSSSNRKFTVTYNQSNRREEEESFIGFDLNWRFTSRTSIQASYGKRFFGDSGTFSLSHNTKHLRTRIGYSEDLTTTSRLLTNFEDQGVFVCPANSVSFSECYLPPSPSYELQPGEQFSNLLVQIPELSEQVILRKSLNASFGLSRRRLSLALSFIHSNIEYLEDNRVQKSNIVTLTNSFQLGNRTNLNLTLNHALTDEESSGIETKTNSASFGISRKLGRHMSTNLNFRYLDRDSSNANLNAINSSNSDLTDRRLTLDFIYNL